MYLRTLLLGDSSNLTHREEYLRTLNHRGRTLLVKQRNQCLARAKLQNLTLCCKCRVWTECLRRSLYRSLIFGCEGTQGVLHTITTLTQYSIWQVGWRLRNEIYTNTLRAYQTHNLK